MKLLSTIFAGFGGQGILFAGKIMAYAGLMEQQEVSWLPSYGPEMRGGTANCSVCLSDNVISCPLVLEPDALVVMNLPSYEKFVDSVTPGGLTIVDSTLVSGTREGTICIPATALAEENGLQGLANMILLGKLLQQTQFAALDTIEKAIRKCISPKKQQLAEPNMQAIRLGAAL